MNKIRLLIVAIFSGSSLVAFEMPRDDLFRLNFRNTDVASQCNIEEELRIFNECVVNETIYNPVARLEDWDDPAYVYPNIHPYHQKIVDTIKALNPKTVCDCGAGAGKVAKYVYAENPEIELTCVEQSSKHISQMVDNFNIRTHVLKPNIKVKSKIQKCSMPDLGIFADDTFDLIYTCTVMMHMPFIVNICSAVEFARISSRYVLHVENRNLGPSMWDKTIVKPSSKMSDLNFQSIDYQRVYESLGFKTLNYYQFKDPNSPAVYIYYLGEKIKR